MPFFTFVTRFSLRSVIAMIIQRGGGPLPKIGSMVAGCLAAAYPLYIGQPERAYELSPLLSVVASWTVFVLAGGLRTAKAVA